MDMTSLATKFLIIGGVLLVLSLPLALRLVPMNKVYGFRTPAAFKSQQNWYEINARGGWMLACGGAVILAAGIAGFFVPAKYSFVYLGVSLMAVAAGTVIPLVCFLSWQRRFGP